MKFKISQSNFFKTLSHLQGIVDKKNSLPNKCKYKYWLENAEKPKKGPKNIFWILRILGRDALQDI